MTVLREGSQGEAVQWVQRGQQLHATQKGCEVLKTWEWSATADIREDFWVCPPRESCHPVTVIFRSNGHAQSFRRWHACSAANEFVCPPRESCHPVTVIFRSNGHAQSFRRWHACSAANEFAEDDASASLQLVTVTQVFLSYSCLLPPLKSHLCGHESY